MKPLFTLGHVVATPGALAAIEESGQQPGDFLARHVNGDWGEMDAQDIKENELSLQHGLRLLSAYRTSVGDKLWVITGTDRMPSCILLRAKYRCGFIEPKRVLTPSKSKRRSMRSLKVNQKGYTLCVSKL